MTDRSFASHCLKLISLILPLLAGALQACGDASGQQSPDSEESVLLVDVAAAVRDEAYDISREFAGRVEARRTSSVGFELGGAIDSVSADDGDYVNRGEVLATLDRDRLDARLAEAEAALAQANAAQELARRTLERSRVAASFEGISEQELDLAEEGADSAAAAVAAAEARVNSVRVDIDKASLRAPYDAVVVARRLDEGQIVSPGQPVLDLQESATPEVRIGVAGDLVQSLAVGDSRSLTVDGRRVAASVRSILPLRDPATRTVDVIFAIDATDVLPGDLARLVLKREIEEPGYWLPTSALAEGGRGLWTAYVAVPAESPSTPGSGATHYLEPRPVEILYETAERVYVRGALADGDLFVTDGLARVVPNQQVRLQRSRQAAAPAVRGS